MNPNKKVGRVTIKVDGDVIESHPDAEIYVGGPERTDKENGNHPGHWSEQLKAGEVKCNIDWGAGDSTAKMAAWTDVTLTCELDTGQTYVGNHYVLKAVPHIKNDKVELEFFGPVMEEMKVA
ncbi:phage tail tube protein [Varunaivibrio sulfuroxidans]|uniref:Tail tube protein n=1 Tax=Varunaivibrio sulfuroxidans TaxID=1773489 RepID=A0A4R3JAJ7_9PROT|nr:phage tail tube protein [Varunaivibrio sulfuroxidans]TCS62587.1 tail tube protein [Varunaivibrio sulfuroxidans]WES30744.1 phage tail tube protein [Varunaivibrio sulfuroxidans]